MAEFIDDERTLSELRRHYKRVRGEDHPNWQEYDEAMVRDGRVVLVVRPDKFYGQVR